MLLNKQQEDFVNRAEDWFFHSSSNLLQLTGGAGTGKSVVLNAVIQRLGLKTEDILPMAYTGQACSVMRRKGLLNACTCHSGLFYPTKDFILDNKGRIIYDPTFNTPLVRWKFIPKDFTNTNIKLIILDEAWMIPKSFKRYIDESGIKVLAAGDPYQLPPVREDPGYLIDGEIHHLTEIMRQNENSPIVYLANRAKAGLPIDYGMYGNDALVVSEDEITDRMLSSSDIILCGKNRTRLSLNLYIRNNILKFVTDYPNFGERVICKKNNWDLEIDGIPLVNGLVGSVYSKPDISQFNGKTVVMDFLPDIMNFPFSVNINLNYLNGTIEDKELLKKSHYTQGELFDYAYASTVHSSQGSEYDAGMYIEEYLGGDSKYQNSLLYTAITRFKYRMILVKHKPKFWNI